LSHSEPIPGTHVWQIAPEMLLPGEGGSFVIDVSVGDYDDVGAVLDNEVTVWAATPDGNWKDNAAKLLTEVMLPDPSVRLTGPEAALVGSIVTYTVTYSNAGTGEARGVGLTDELPAGVSYLSDDSRLALSQPAPGTLVWDVGTLLPGEGGSFSMVAQLGTVAETGLMPTSLLKMTSDTPDPVPANSSSQWPVAIRLFSHYLPVVLKVGP
jgi:uncharacterized repeat protein (TIGR01451 family)